MFINKKKKNIVVSLFTLLLCIGGVYFSNKVNAAGVKVTYGDKKTFVCYNRKTGDFTGTADSASGCKNQGYGQTSVKIINNVNAYCVNWKLPYYTDANYVVDNTWKVSSENAIKAGYLIDYVNSRGFSVDKAYERVGASVNTFFHDIANDSGSYDYSSNAEISSYLKQADNKYNSIKNYLTNTLPSPNINISNSVLSYNDTTKKYFSGQITVSNLVATYGGDDIVEYIVSAKTSGGTGVDLCTKADGTGCKTGSVDLSNRSSNYTFYIFASSDKVKAGDSIVVTVKGNNQSTYLSSTLYDDSSNDDAQKLIVITDYKVPRSVSKSMTVTIPDLTNHRIRAYKVDENGDALEGATLEIYKDNVSGSPLVSNNGNGYDVIYTTPNVTSGSDDFFNHDYYLVEKKAPSGYIISSAPIKIYTKGTGKGMGLTCYSTSESGEMTKVEEEFCYPERYGYMCKHPTTGDLIAIGDDENCPVVPTTDLVVNNDSGDEVVTNGSEQGTVTPDSTGENGGIYDTMATYTKVCYNKDKETVVDNKYCNKKGSYTKVWNGGDGNISIKKPNTKNLVKISKKTVTGDKEIVGASLKICTAATYKSAGNKCVAAKNVDGLSLSWISGEVAHSIYGLPVGSYYIIEVVPPSGYINATIAVSFSINEKGEVTTGQRTITYDDFVKDDSKAIVIENNLTGVTISKQDITNSKELAGATISICRTYVDSDGKIKMLVDQYTGDCIEAVLADGSPAIWVSTNKPKQINGLAPGTYYLVERIAPTDYSTAESILFTLKEDGSLIDANGKSLKNNKLVMYDEPLENEKTGSLTLYIVLGGLVGTISLGVVGFLYFKKNDIKLFK